MNKAEVITVINAAGNRFGRVMAHLCGAEYAAGYKQAVGDMVRLFDAAPIDPDFDAERENLLQIIDRLTAENERLENEVCEKHATIQRLLSHVNVAEILGVDTKKQKMRRPVAFFTLK